MLFRSDDEANSNITTKEAKVCPSEEEVLAGAQRAASAAASCSSQPLTTVFARQSSRRTPRAVRESDNRVVWREKLSAAAPVQSVRDAGGRHTECACYWRHRQDYEPSRLEKAIPSISTRSSGRQTSATA